MKSFKLMMLGLAAVALLSSCGNKESEKEMTTFTDSVSYTIGNDIGKNLQKSVESGQIEVTPEFIAKGIISALDTSVDLLLTDEDMKAVMDKFQEEIQRKQIEEQQAQLDQAAKTSGPEKEMGAKFLAENKTKDGVITTASGLQYKVIKQGKGAKPAATDKVRVHYHGTFLNGTVFDSSLERGEPVEFPLNGVIPGWTEGLQLMNIGSKYTLFLSSDLAYGDRGDGQKIPGGATLIFDVELLDIVK